MKYNLSYPMLVYKKPSKGMNRGNSLITGLGFATTALFERFNNGSWIITLKLFGFGVRIKKGEKTCKAKNARHHHN